jgi:hypothetical protein
MSDFDTTKTVKAKKRHKCEHCRGVIKPGTFYVHIAGVYGGAFFSMRSHPYCEEIRNRVIAACDIGYGDEMMELPDEIHESIHAKGMYEIAINYNAHAVSVGGVIVDLSEVDPPNSVLHQSTAETELGGGVHPEAK